jgi:LacI family transcriptional regulator
MATIRDVAKRADVSVGTVSNVLAGSESVSPERRAKVMAAIEALDYQPNYIARSLKARRTKTLGLIISNITNPFFPQLARGAEEAAFQGGYLLITFNTDDRVEREQQVLSLLRSRRVDGVLLVVAPSPENDVSHILKTSESGIPIVCLDRMPPGLALDSVSIDNVAAAQLCVRHLISRGHRRIGIITGGLSLQTARDRLEGYKAALQDAGIEPERALIVEGNFRSQSGYRLGKDLLLRRNPPTAIFSSNGMMTVGLIQALNETGMRCPGDIAVVSFDDLPFADVFQPHLTSLIQPAYQIGYDGSQLMIQKLEGVAQSRKPVHLRLIPELKIRESTLTGHLREDEMECTPAGGLASPAGLATRAQLRKKR